MKSNLILHFLLTEAPFDIFKILTYLDHIIFSYTAFNLVVLAQSITIIISCTDLVFLLLLLLRGKGGVPWVQIMENELEYLADRGGHGGH